MEIEISYHIRVGFLFYALFGISCLAWGHVLGTHIYIFLNFLFGVNSSGFAMLLFADYRCFGNVGSYVT